MIEIEIMLQRQTTPRETNAPNCAPTCPALSFWRGAFCGFASVWNENEELLRAAKKNVRNAGRWLD